MTPTPTSGAADLRTAAQAVVERWDTPLWKDVPATAEYIGRLRAALSAGQATAAPAQPAAQQGAQHLAQALTDRENQPNQYGVEFGMSGTHMHFKIGNQLFKLAYEPDEQEEFDFMKRMLVNAFTTFTHDVNTAPQPSPAAQGDALDAARYRWLAASCRSTSEHWGGRWSIIIDGPAPKSHDSEDDFDAAIDAARAAQEGKGHDN